MSTRLRCLIGRLALVWFALALGVATASPLVQPKAMQWVCSGGGVVKAAIADDDGAASVGASHLDCPLCLPICGAPPSAASTAQPTLSPKLVRASTAVFSVPLAFSRAWHARGPPAA